MRRVFVMAVLALLTACWDENVVLAECVKAGRCSPPPPDQDAGLDGGADAGSADAGAADAGVEDAGASDGGEVDAGPLDAGVTDAGSDAGVTDAGMADAGERDGGVTDAGATDAGMTDAGAPDAGAPDAGAPDAGGADAGIDAGVIDSGVADAGKPDAGIDAGVIDSGVVDAGLPDAGQVDAGPPRPRNGAACTLDGQCASNRCTSGSCVVWSANTTGAIQYFGALSADPMGGLFLGADTTAAFDAGVPITTAIPNSFWLRSDGASTTGGLLGTPWKVVDIAWSGTAPQTPQVLCTPTPYASSKLVTLSATTSNAPTTSTTYLNFVGTSIALAQNSTSLNVAGTNLVGATTSNTTVAAILNENATIVREFSSAGDAPTGTLNAAVTRFVPYSTGALVVGGWFRASTFEFTFGNSVSRLRINSDAFVARVENSNVPWSVHFSADGNVVEVKSLVVQPLGGYLVALLVRGGLYLGSSATQLLPAMGTEHVVLVSLSSGGSLVWARAIGNLNGTTTSAGLAINDTGVVVIAGETPATGTLIFEDGGVIAGSTSTVGTSAWVAVLDSSGALVSSRRFSCASGTVGTPELKFGGVAFDAVSGGVLVGGQSNCAFDLGDGQHGGVDNQSHIFWGNLGRWW